MINRMPYCFQWVFYKGGGYALYERLVLRPRWDAQRIRELELEVNDLLDDPEYAAEQRRELAAIEDAYQRTDPSLPWVQRCCIAVGQVRRAAGGQA